MTKSLRPATGNAIIETGPALFVLLVLIFFPLLDIMGIAVGYQMASTYHDRMIREIAVRTPDATGYNAAVARVNGEIINGPFYNFLRMQPADLQVVLPPTYIPDPTKSPGHFQAVRVRTTVTIRPFIIIPFIGNVPGLSAPVPFTMTTERPQEEQGIN
ncbi:MAG: hypothetical protein K2W82_01670 [Candidatus Obscuribacterales bacterium]|nr:hypothetical protein [Candidatus Obscuribacterales bacterium]